jgi:peptide/nickel transport system substrate-binding protein
VVLRDGLTWHDGTPFDAAAVKAGLDRNLFGGNPFGQLPQGFFALGSVDVVDPTTVRLNVPGGTATGWYDAYIASWETSIAKPDDDFDQPIGAGPLRVVEFTPEQSLTLERFDGYWNADAVNFAGIELVHVAVTSPESGVAALRAGQIDVTGTTVAQIPALTGDLEVKSVQIGSRMTYGMICKDKPPFDDVRVRRALNKAIDREAVNEAIYEGTATPGTLFFPEGQRLFTEEVADDLDYDPDGARRLLADAGLSGGVTFDLYVNQGLGIPDVAQVVEQQLKEVGITANLVPAPDFVGQFLGVQAAGVGLVPGNGGVGALNNLVGANLGNACQYDDPELKSLAARLQTVSATSAEAVEIWDEINTLYAEDALNLVILFPSNLGAFNSEVLEIGGINPRGGFFVPDIYTSFIRSDG